MKLETTLNEIRRMEPCRDGWGKLLASLSKTKADDEPVSFRHILRSNGPYDLLWSLRVLPPEMDNDVRLLICDLVEPAMRVVPDGEARPQEAINAARAFARGEITERELAAASDAARAAAWAAASDAARDASWAAARVSACDAASEAAWAATWDAASDASWSAMALKSEHWLDEMEARE